MLRTLRSKLIASVLFVVFISLTFASLIFYQFLTSYTKELKTNELIYQAENLAKLVQQRRNIEDQPIFKTILALESRLIRAKLILINSRAEVIRNLSNIKSFEEEKIEIDLEALADGETLLVERDIPDTKSKALLAIAPVFRVGKFDGAVILIAPLKDINQEMMPLIKLLLMAALFGFIFAALIGFYLSISITGPVRELTRAARSMSEGELKQRVQTGGSEEISELSRAFNDMAEKIEKAYQIQKDFIANVSHELRTPLTSIEGFTQAILDGVAKDKDTVEKSLHNIEKETKRLSRMIKDLLDLSTIEAGELRLNIKETEIKDYITGIYEKLKPLAQRKEVELKIELLGDVGAMRVDEDRLEQVLTNLTENAIKYTKASGKVTMRVYKSGTSKVKIEVSDNGIGISAEELPKIFDRFYCIEKSRSRRLAGTGLGLAIAKELIQKLGGEISVVSRPEEGTTFTITLPSA